MAQLSVLAEMFKKMEGQKNQPGKGGTRISGGPPALPGMARGASGSLGSKTLQSRNPYAGEQKELGTMQSPIFLEFMRKLMPQTPITNWMAGKR